MCHWERTSPSSTSRSIRQAVSRKVSRNRSEHVEYSVKFISFKDGKPQTAPEPFLTRWMLDIRSQMFGDALSDSMNCRMAACRAALETEAGFTFCHTKATTSIKLADNLLPTADACVACHKDVKIKTPGPLRLQNFDHALHVKHELLRGCDRNAATLGHEKCVAACHRGTESSTAIKADVKQHFPHMADCLVCHIKIDPPFSCETATEQTRR